MKSPAFQFYSNDFLGGRVATYSLEEIGLYSVLLAFDWSLIGLPFEHEKLAKLARVGKRKFTVLWATVGDNFVLRDGRYYNPRLELERQKQAENRAKKVAAAHSRWNADADAGAMQVECPSSSFAFASAVALPKETSSSSSADVARLLDGLPNDVVRLSWQSEIDGARQGMHGAVLTDEQINQACRDYVGNGHLASPTLRHFRAFMASAARPPRPSTNGTADSYDALKKWAADRDAEEAAARAAKEAAHA